MVDYPSSTDISYDYDAVNQLTNMTDAVGTTSFTYTDNGKIKTEDGPWSNDTVTYTYNDADRLSQVAVPRPGETDWTQDFGYDNSRRLDTITAPEGTYSYAYLNAGKRVQQLDLPNGSYVTNQFDNVARMDDTELRDSSSVILREHEYNYNQGNQRTQQIRTDGSYVDYTYDDLGQLESGRAYTSGGSSLTGEWFGYDYDPAWNLKDRTNGTSSVTSFTVNSNNELTTGYTYDDNGNMPDDSGFDYTYDDENQLVSAENSKSFAGLTCTSH